jgi:hypothetical protein
MKLECEPSSEPLHISAKWLFLNRERDVFSAWQVVVVQKEHQGAGEVLCEKNTRGEGYIKYSQCIEIQGGWGPPVLRKIEKACRRLEKSVSRLAGCRGAEGASGDRAGDYRVTPEPQTLTPNLES